MTAFCTICYFLGLGVHDCSGGDSVEVVPYFWNEKFGTPSNGAQEYALATHNANEIYLPVKRLPNA